MLSEGNKIRDKYMQQYSVDLKSGEHFQIVVTSQKFKFELMPGFKFDSIERLGIVKSISESPDNNFVRFDSVFVKDGMLLFTISNSETVTGDETYTISVIIADESVRKISSDDLCDNILFLMTHAKYDFFMLKGPLVERTEAKNGYVEVYNSIFGYDEIDAYEKGATEYLTILYYSSDIKEAKKKLDEYISSAKKCLAGDNYNNKEEYEDFDKELGKDFGVVSYTAYYNKDSFPYMLNISLGQEPVNKNYITLLKFSLEWSESNY
jgi:hypothetical protein